MKIRISYGCVNGAFHTNKCCNTCWNKHPQAKPGKMFLGTTEQKLIAREMWINKAESTLSSHPSRDLLEFLYDNFQQL
jgi:hypothetical protein